ncbi:MAG: hypothetical protein F6K36_25940 [Symploca sp. SIO3C6]|nr:hypothetical protein [Symploca sp. SIO3C6]
MGRWGDGETLQMGRRSRWRLVFYLIPRSLLPWSLSLEDGEIILLLC